MKWFYVNHIFNQKGKPEHSPLIVNNNNNNCQISLLARGLTLECMRKCFIDHYQNFDHFVRPLFADHCLVWFYKSRTNYS